jgi:hypothetical protein
VIELAGGTKGPELSKLMSRLAWAIAVMTVVFFGAGSGLLNSVPVSALPAGLQRVGEK